MPVRNEERHLAESVRHILSQEEVRALIQALWEKDKLVIVDLEEIFHE